MSERPVRPSETKKPTAFHVIAKPVGPICNLDCRYCFYLEKERIYPDNKGMAAWAMRGEVLESFVRQYIEAQEVPVVSFAWQGGEPTLLGIDFFRRAVELQKKYSGGKRVENGFQTNGVLLDDRWCEFLAANRFLVGLSIDGPSGLHDSYRVDRGGKPTLPAVMKAASLLKKHAVDFNSLTVVQRHNADSPLEVYRFLKEIGSGFMQFIPGVGRCASTVPPDGLALVSPGYRAEAGVTEWSVRPLQYGNFLCAVFDEWVRRDVGRCFVQLFDVALESWCGLEPALCVYRRTCGEAMAIEHNGDLYSCDHYVYPANRLGNIADRPLASMAASEQQREFGGNKLESLPRYCRECEVRFACNGECPKNRFVTTPEGEEGLNYLCAGLRRFFHHVDPHMRFMAGELREQRAPANVMSWVREQESSDRRSPKPGRNDPCPCGSGRKYKKCCGSGT
jgi:uncharacterized protein